MKVLVLTAGVDIDTHHKKVSIDNLSKEDLFDCGCLVLVTDCNISHLGQVVSRLGVYGYELRKQKKKAALAIFSGNVAGVSEIARQYQMIVRYLDWQDVGKIVTADKSQIKEFCNFLDGRG